MTGRLTLFARTEAVMLASSAAAIVIEVLPRLPSRSSHWFDLIFSLIKKHWSFRFYRKVIHNSFHPGPRSFLFL